MDKPQHKVLANWAIRCAEHVLFNFEARYPKDKRPRQALEAARLWVKGEMKVSEARKFAFAAHAAARVAEDLKAKAAARSAGHAAATPHVSSHAKYAASYALKAASDPISEQVWQNENKPAGLKFIQ